VTGALAYSIGSLLFESASPLTISHTIRPNDWHRVSLSLSLPLFLFSLFSFLFLSLSPHDTAFEEKQHRVLYPGQLGGPEIELQVTTCRARRASELGNARRNSRTHTFACGTRMYVLIPRIPWPLSIERVFHVFFLLLSKRYLFHATLTLERREGAARGIHLIDRFTASEDIPSPHYPWHVFSRAAFPLVPAL